MTRRRHRSGWRKRWWLPPAILVAAGALGVWGVPALGKYLVVDRLESTTGREVSLDNLTLNPFTATAMLDGFAIAGEGETPVFASRRSEIDMAWASLWQSGWRIQRIELTRPELRLKLDQQGRFNLAQLFSGGGSGGSPTAVHIKHLITHDGTLGWHNQSRQRPASLTLEHLDLEVRDYDSSRQQPFVLKGQSQLGGGDFSAQGKLGFSPWTADLDFSGDQVALSTFSPWLASLIRARVTGGALSARGHFSAGVAANGAIRLSGQASLDDLALLDPRNDMGLLQAGKVQASEIAFDSQQSLAIGNLAVQAPRLYAVINEDMSTNLSALTPPGNTQQGSGDQQHNASGQQHDTGQSMGFSLDRLRVDQGHVRFVDQHLGTPFRLDIARLQGSLSSLSTQGDGNGQLKLQGRVNDDSPIRIDGNFSPLGQPLSGELRMVAEDLALKGFTPYVRRFAGYAVDGGKVNLDLHYRIAQGQLDAANHIVLHRLELGDRVADSQASLPLRKLVGVLQNDDGIIDLNIPLQASLDGTSLDVSEVVWQAIGKVAGNIVTSPLDTLSAMASGSGADGGASSDDSGDDGGYDEGAMSEVVTQPDGQAGP